MLALVLMGPLGSCRDGAARQGTPLPVRPAPVPAEVGAVAGGVDFLATLGRALAVRVIMKGLESSGLFEAIGLGGPDPWTRAKLDEITGKLEDLDRDVIALAHQVQLLESLAYVVPARARIAEQQSLFETCYARLKTLADAVEVDPALAEEHNRTLLARTYQVAGLAVPPGLVVLDDDCAILAPLQQIQSTILPIDPQADRPLLRMAIMARTLGRPFDEVVQYFAWVVGIQQHAMAIIAQAHHRLGEESMLAQLTAAFDDSLRLQELELLHAAEQYVTYQLPYDTPANAAALALADVVVSRMEGHPRLVTAGVLYEPVPGLTLAPAVVQGTADPVPLDAGLVTPDETYYRDPRTIPVAPHYYAQQLAQGSGVEVGWSDRVVIARFMTPQVDPGTTAARLDIAGAPAAQRALVLDRRNAATLLTEAEPSAAVTGAADRDRLLLAHSSGLASTAARFQVVPTDEDPRQVRLAVALPSRAPGVVTVGPLDGAATAFAARDGALDAVFEQVPLGPAEPERFAFRLGDRWLGLPPADPAAPASPEAASQLTTVLSPFYFDVVREGGAHVVSFADERTGLRRYLYVNEQVRAASDWQVATRGASVNLLTMPTAFDPTTPQMQANCSMVAGLTHQPTLTIRGGGAVPVKFQLAMGFAGWGGTSGNGYVRAGSCYMIKAGRLPQHLASWINYSWSRFPNCWLPAFSYQEWTQGCVSSYWAGTFTWDVAPGEEYQLVCEHSSPDGACWAFNTLTLTVVPP